MQERHRTGQKRASTAPLPTVSTAAIEDLVRLRAVRGSKIVIDSQVRGASMGAAIPNGARIRIRAGAVDSLRTGSVIAFLAGRRVMVHRIVYEGRRGSARNFLLTQGDGNWLCDPPVARSMVVGEVEAVATAGEWQTIPAPRMPFWRRLVAQPLQMMVRLTLEWNPAFATLISRLISRLRMGPRPMLGRLRQLCAGHVRH
jgi:hypothetical protein